MTQRLIVTNYNRNFTGVSATTANVIRAQMAQYDVALVGQALPGCPAPITPAQARKLSRGAVPFVIWHVRRNTEMRSAIWARDVLRLPIKIVFTSAAQRRHSALPRWLISRMDAVVATTDRAADFVPNVRGVVPHGVDTAVFSPADDRAAAWATLGYGGTHGIASIGRIRPEKGSDRFVDAMLRLLPQRPSAVALMIGRAAPKHQSFLDDLQAKITAAGLTDRILFPGEVAADQLPALMRGLSLVMQLPRYEGYGMVPLEGMASGVPFVASDAGYYEAFSQGGTAGKVIKGADQIAQQAADAALAMLENGIEPMGQHARHVVIDKFSAQAEANGIDQVYQSLSQGK